MGEARLAGVEDAALVADIAARGFYLDPVMTWVFPDDATRLAQLHLAFTGLVDTYLPDSGTVHLLDSACTSLWRSPEFDHSGGGARGGPREAAAAAAIFEAGALERLMIVGSTMAAAHPHSPHWYLNVLSTIPERQSQGLGATTLAPVLSVCDSQGVPAYLESSNPRNIPFYQRQGFELTGELALPDGPSIYPMWRDPVPAS